MKKKVPTIEITIRDGQCFVEKIPKGVELKVTHEGLLVKYRQSTVKGEGMVPMFFKPKHMIETMWDHSEHEICDTRPYRWTAYNWKTGKIVSRKNGRRGKS